MLVYAIICSKSKNTISCCAMWNITEAICCLNFITPFSILSWLLMKKMVIIILHLFARPVQVSLLQNYFYLSLFLFFCHSERKPFWLLSLNTGECWKSCCVWQEEETKTLPEAFGETGRYDNRNIWTTSEANSRANSRACSSGNASQRKGKA